jgi:drug/metabolite transporter (DMT)-like permease
MIALIGFTPFIIHLKKINTKIVIYGAFSGILYYFAVVTQTYGLQTTSAGKAGFITGLSTVMVPFIAWLIFRKKFNKRIWLAVGLSVSGMAFLLLDGKGEVLIGDILILICAVFCALFIIYNDKYVKLVDIFLYSIVQLIMLTLLCFGSSLLINESYNLSKNADIGFWLIMFYMGFIATTLTFLFVNWGQQHHGPSKTAIIFALEPVFAVLFASFLIGNEVLTWQMWIGCGLIFIAILITVLKNDDLIKHSEENLNST